MEEAGTKTQNGSQVVDELLNGNEKKGLKINKLPIENTNKELKGSAEDRENDQSDKNLTQELTYADVVRRKQRKVDFQINEKSLI